MNTTVTATSEAKQLLIDWLEGIEILGSSGGAAMARELGGAWSIGTHEDPLLGTLFALANHRHATLIAEGWAQEEPNNG